VEESRCPVTEIKSPIETMEECGRITTGIDEKLIGNICPDNIFFTEDIRTPSNRGEVLSLSDKVIRDLFSSRYVDHTRDITRGPSGADQGER